jgi:hypothetical protein
MDMNTDPHGVICVFMSDKQTSLWDTAFKAVRKHSKRARTRPAQHTAEQ